MVEFGPLDDEVKAKERELAKAEAAASERAHCISLKIAAKMKTSGDSSGTETTRIVGDEDDGGREEE